ncbi:RS24 protein, partial [Crocuta crocuta]
TNDTVSIRTGKVKTNRLLRRKQTVTDVLRPETATEPEAGIRGKGAGWTGPRQTPPCVWTQGPCVGGQAGGIGEYDPRGHTRGLVRRGLYEKESRERGPRTEK